MSKVRVLLAAGAATLGGAAANAADMPSYPPPPQYIQQYAPPEFASEWYLRGDIGMSNQKVSSLFNVLYAGNSVVPVGMGFDSAPLFGLGFGYQYNNWFRFDLTGEYRGKANFHGLDIVNASFTDEYHASKSEWLFLGNAYADLGTWWCVTPFVGAGLGFSRNTISSFLDVNTPNLGVAFGAEESKWNFAWALHAGLAVKATPTMTVELAYRYVNLGDAQSGDLITYQGTNNVNNPMQFRGITSHDFKLGVRWVCCDIAPAPQPQIAYRQPPPVYQQPQYVQPQYQQPVYQQPQPVYQQPQQQLYVPPPAYPPPPPTYGPPLMRKG
jgi:opacity protein-like surface antigen